MTEVAADPVWFWPWVILLTIPLLGGALWLSTDIGRQAAIDERVRVTEAFGGMVDDVAYARLQTAPPYEIYLMSGGRVLLLPTTTLVVAAGLFALARRDTSAVRFREALAVTVHASAILVAGQVVAMPFNLVRESMTNPTTLAAFLPLLEDGSAPAVFFGSIDVFGIWWMLVLAMGVSAMTGRPARHHAGPLAAVYAAVAGILAAAVAVLGGS